MRWPAAMFLAAACAVGCRNTPSTFDPFLPNRRIPPPGTGAASGAPDAYYTSPSSPYGGSAPVYQAPAYQTPAYPAPAAGGANGPFAPGPAPAGGGFGTVPGPAPTSSQVSPPAGQAPRFAKASYVTTADDEPSAVYQRRSAAPNAEASSAGSSPARPTFTGSSSARSSAQPIDIMDLPPAVASR